MREESPPRPAKTGGFSYACRTVGGRMSAKDGSRITGHTAKRRPPSSGAVSFVSHEAVFDGLFYGEKEDFRRYYAIIQEDANFG